MRKRGSGKVGGADMWGRKGRGTLISPAPNAPAKLFELVKIFWNFFCVFSQILKKWSHKIAIKRKNSCVNP